MSTEANSPNARIRTRGLLFLILLNLLCLPGQASAQGWAGYPPDEGGNIDTGSWMGRLYVELQPWLLSQALQRWIYAPDPGPGAAGAWAFLPEAVEPGAPGYYVDPVNGSMDNPGTATEPWSTLEAVFEAGKSFADGDVIYLRSGDHGFPVIKERNGANVTITAEAGHNPVLNRIDFNGAAYWVLDNVSVHTTGPLPEAPVLVHPVYAQVNNSLLRILGVSQNITIRNCKVYSALDSSSWTANDWNSKAWTGIYMGSSSHHLLIDGCEVLNSNFGIHMTNDTHDIVIRDSVVKNFCGDGMRANCDNLVIEGCQILDAYDTNGNHDDMIQGFSSSNVVIRGNIFLSATGNRPLISSAQVIGAFSGWFDNWVVENNIIASRHWHGISLYGARNCRIANNTVVHNPYGSGTGTPWIRLDPLNTGTPGSGNYCVNNLTSNISTMSGATVSNNIETTNYTSHFVNYSALDFHLKATSSAVDAGTTDHAPTVDFEGDPRDSTPDVGADEL